MARVVKAPDGRDVRIVVRADQAARPDSVSAPEIMLVPGGRRAYLWIGDDNVFCTVSGPAALRNLAHAILKELPAQRPRGRR